jgi:hypothetical protein
MNKIVKIIILKRFVLVKFYVMAVKTYSYVFEDLAVVLEVVFTHEVVGALLRSVSVSSDTFV